MIAGACALWSWVCSERCSNARGRIAPRVHTVRFVEPVPLRKVLASGTVVDMGQGCGMVHL